MSANAPALDLTSTSPNFGLVLHSQPQARCIYANVWFAYQIEGKSYGISQGCCNHWDCPRCGQVRAKREYARMVSGIERLRDGGFELYFQTVTCRGRELSRGEADNSYLQWTNRLLDSYRARVKSKGGHWCYVQVTERQKRGLPHSHFLTTFEPDDLKDGFVTKWEKRQGDLVETQKPALRSDWLQRAVIRSGLGEQYDISRVRSASAASRYVAKYLFKQTVFDSDWPKGWRRIRYSQNFPKLPSIKTNAFVLRKQEDWHNLGKSAVVVNCADVETFEYASYRLMAYDTIVRQKKNGTKRETNRDAGHKVQEGQTEQNGQDTRRARFGTTTGFADETSSSLLSLEEYPLLYGGLAD